MTEAETTRPTTGSLDDMRAVLDVISTAAGLGIEFPTPSGMSVWVVTQAEEDHSWIDISVHPTEESAVAELAWQVLGAWAEDGRTALPWNQDLENYGSEEESISRANDWISKNGNSKLVDLYFEANPNFYYSIRHETVQKETTTVSYTANLDKLSRVGLYAYGKLVK